MTHCAMLPCPMLCSAVVVRCVCPGVIQVSDRDEWSYQEMLTHVPVGSLEVRSREELGDGSLGRVVERG